MLLEVEGLSKLYGRHWAIRDVDLTIRPGLFSVVGPNGAGKTTLFRMLAGILAPSRGRIMFNGRDIARQATVYRDRIGYKPQNIDVYTNETVAAGLEYFARLKHIPPRLIPQRIDWALDTFHLTEIANRPLTQLSKGERQRFFLAQALLADPDILILDEPTTGLDSIGRIELIRLLNRWSIERIVIVSTHIIADVKPFDGRMLVLRDGQVCACSTPSLLAQRAVDKVWELQLPADAAQAIADIQKQYTVTAFQPLEPNQSTNGMSSGVVIRLISDRPPHPAAKPVPPTLEEGYLVSLM